MTTDNFFSFANRLIQTSQTGGQQYSDTFPFGISFTTTISKALGVEQRGKKVL